MNVAIFGCTSKDWRNANPKLAEKKMNIRDIASINELAVLSNLESMNADMIRGNIDKEERFHKLKTVAKYQIEILNESNYLKTLKKKSEDTFIKEQKKISKDE